VESVFLFQDGVYHFSKGMPLWLENRFQDSEMEPFVFAMGGGGLRASLLLLELRVSGEFLKDCRPPF